MATYQTSGIVIKRFNFGEADRIITFLTPEHGKLKGVARGVRKIKSKLAGHLELFSESKLMLAKGRNLDVLTSARLEHLFDLTSNYEALGQAYMMAEMVDKLVPEESAASGVYGLMAGSLARLEAGSADELAELSFKVKLLDQLGYTPELWMCVTCHRPLGQVTTCRFNAEQGGLIHEACSKGWELRLSIKGVALWRSLSAGNLPVNDDFAQSATSQVLKSIDQFYAQLFNHRFHAKLLLDVK